MMSPDAARPRRILVVEDDRKTADLVALYLRHAGYELALAHSGTAAEEKIQGGGFDLCILDVMLPGTSGLDLCRRIREHDQVPIILLTAQALEKQVIAGLEQGADDYVTKPFSPRELVARVNSLFRRAAPGRDATIRVADVRVERDTRRVFVGADEVSLTPSEFAVLEALVESPGRVLTRAQLVSRIPNRGPAPLERTVDVHVSNLRAKLSASERGPDLIQTVFGLGYRCAA